MTPRAQKPAEHRKPWLEVWGEIVSLKPMELKGCNLVPNEHGWLTIHCLRHDDEHPSLRVNVQSGGTKCMSRNCEVGNLNDLLDLLRETTRSNRRRPKFERAVELPAAPGFDTDTPRKKPRDPLAYLAERRALPREHLEGFGVEPATRGYVYPVDDPEAKGARRWKRGDWVDPLRYPAKYQWRPKGVPANNLVYNLARAREKMGDDGGVYICAGEPDVWVMDFLDLPAISFLAGEGARPSAHAIQKLLDASVLEVTILYDHVKDEAARQRARKRLGEVADAMAPRGIRVNVADISSAPIRDMPNGFDITDLWRTCGAIPEAFVAELHALSTMEHNPPTVAEDTELEGAPLPSLDLCWEVALFRGYRDAVSDYTNAGDPFHLFALLNITGIIIGRRFYTQYAGRKYPAHYTLLTGSSAISRKTTVMKLVIRMLREATGNEIPVIVGAHGSGEALIESLAYAGVTDDQELEDTRKAIASRDTDYLSDKNQRRVQVAQDEISSVFAKSRSDSSTLIPTLLMAHGCPEDIELRTRGKPAYAFHPVLALIGTSTAELLQGSLPRNSWSTGLINRFAVVLANPKPVIPHPGDVRPVPWEKVRTWLRNLYEDSKAADDGREHELEWTLEAERVWREWLEAHERVQTRRTAEERGATARSPDLAVQFALIFALTDHGNELDINETDMRRGIACAEYGEACVLRLVNELTKTGKTVVEEILVRAIREAWAGSKGKRGISGRDLWRSRRKSLGANGCDSAGYMHEILSGLKSAGLIEGDKNEWRPVG